MRNFYNYLLHHDVCPEYQSDIEAARKICDIGATELLVIQRLGQLLPGQFNVAVSAFSGGYYQHELRGSQPWEEDPDNVNTEEIRNRFKSIIKKAIINLEGEGLSPSITRSLDRETDDRPYFTCIGESQVALEVIDIVPSKIITDKQQSKNNMSTSELIGKLVCKRWKMPSFETFDVAPSAKTKPEGPRKIQYEFLIENEILEQCFIGMKMEVTVRRLEEGGLEYLDSVQTIYCSFYTLLPNDLMMHWKEPEWVTSEKDVETAEAAEEAAIAVY